MALISVRQARQILGTASKEYTDQQLLEMVQTIENLSDSIIQLALGSKYKPPVA